MLTTDRTRSGIWSLVSVSPLWPLTPDGDTETQYQHQPNTNNKQCEPERVDNILCAFSQQSLKVFLVDLITPGIMYYEEEERVHIVMTRT